MAWWTKRAVDFFLALGLIVLLSPVFMLVSLLVYGWLGRPLLFRQERIGLRDRRFSIFKFRTMTNQTDNHGQLLPSKDRLTPLGARLRSMSLDELPQLFNVLRGELSLVGPRPLLAEYLPLYSERHRRRHNVRPGITGWAQVNGRNTLSWNERFELDIWYVENWSLRLDLWILLKTIQIVVTGRGSQPASGTIMKRFRGYTNDHD